MPFDHDSTRLTTSVAAMAGGALWSMANIFALLFSPTTPDRRTVIRAFVETLFSIIAGGIGGLYVAPAIVRAFHIESVETISLIGLVVGISFWKSVPLLTRIGIKLNTGSIAKILPGAPDDGAGKP